MSKLNVEHVVEVIKAIKDTVMIRGNREWTTEEVFAGLTGALGDFISFMSKEARTPYTREQFLKMAKDALEAGTLDIDA